MAFSIDEEDKRKKKVVNVRMELSLWKQLRAGARRAGLEFSEYIRRRLKHGQ